MPDDLVAELRPAALLAALDAGLGAAGGHALLRADRAARRASGSRRWRACSMAIVLALVVFRMPATMVAAAGALGVIFGLIRIAWIIVASIFLYNIAVETGQFQVMKESIAALSTDKRLQLILIAFCFGAFLEGTGGGGAPVAIAGSFLIGLGFEPFQAATLCLLANTAPWPGAASATRSACSAGVTGLPEPALSAMTGRILPPSRRSCRSGWCAAWSAGDETCEVWPALAVSGLSFALLQFYWSNYQESGLVDIIAALVSLLAMVAFLKVWRPKTSLTIDEEPRPALGRRPEGDEREAIPGDRPGTPRPGAQGLVSLPAGLGVHLRLGHAGDRPGVSPRVAASSRCPTCTARSCGCRRSSPTPRPRMRSPT